MKAPAYPQSVCIQQSNHTLPPWALPADPCCRRPVALTIGGLPPEDLPGPRHPHHFGYLSRGWPVWDSGTLLLPPDGSPIDFKSSSLPSAFPLFARRLSLQGGWGQVGHGAFTSGCSAVGREPGSQALPGWGWAGPEDKGHFLHPLSNAPDSWWGDSLLGYWRPGKPVWLTLQVPHAPRGSSGSPGQTHANCPGTTALEPSGTPFSAASTPGKGAKAWDPCTWLGGVPPLPRPARCPFFSSSLPSWMGRGLLRVSSGERTPASCCGQRLGPGHCLEHPP